MHLSLKMNWEKLNFEQIGNSLHSTEYLALGKALLARLYLKVKVYKLTYKVYISYKSSHALNEII